jgi:hypothetical protein
MYFTNPINARDMEHTKIISYQQEKYTYTYNNTTGKNVTNKSVQ